MEVLRRHEESAMNTEEYAVYLQRIVDYVRKVKHDTGRKVHIHQYPFSIDQGVMYCGRVLPRKLSVTESHRGNYEADDHEEVFCQKCLTSLLAWQSGSRY